MANKSFTCHMTNEKLIEVLKECFDKGLNFEESADHLIKNGVTVQQWVPVSERLPEEYETVLTYDGYSVEPSVFYGSNGFYELDNEAYPLFGITHWMPLPDPPEVAP